MALLFFTENENERTKATLSLSLFEVRTAIYQSWSASDNPLIVLLPPRNRTLPHQAASLLWALAVLDSPHTAVVSGYLMRYASFLLLDARGKGADGACGGRGPLATCLRSLDIRHKMIAGRIKGHYSVVLH